MTSKTLLRIAPAALVLAVTGCGNTEFTHVKPGNSARAYLEEKKAPPAVPVEVSRPGSLPIPADHPAPKTSSANNAAVLPLPEVPGDPGSPAHPGVGDKVADLYTRGATALGAGQTGEAILALEEATKLDPAFVDAWTKLAAAYSKAGQDAKAITAYKTAKKLGQSTGGAGNGGALIP